ncbi:hypothetical protein [Demequina lutea]|uniref:Uncharacterized protein n=1 Tax=Demequina lutea TaxID=431489 RepID=A0A7Y9Z9H7_9MICO|nr:hypothetical protein [Demequina lutea]NYI39970.1 hypothetical protein [Demequina lutea]
MSALLDESGALRYSRGAGVETERYAAGFHSNALATSSSTGSALSSRRAGADSAAPHLLELVADEPAFR